MRNLLKLLRGQFVVGVAVAVAMTMSIAYADTLGTMDSEDILISMSVSQLVQITPDAGNSGISFSVDDTNAQAGVSDDEQFCVYSNATSAGYTVTGTSGSLQGDFTLTGPGNVIYTVSVDDGSTSEALVHGTPSSTLLGDGTTPGCTTANLTVTVAVAGTELEQAESGSYTDTLTLTVNPM